MNLIVTTALLGAVVGQDMTYVELGFFCLLGFGVVVFTLAVLAFATWVVGLILKYNSPGEPNGGGGSKGVNPEHQVVIAAAVAAVLDRPFTIRSVKPARSGTDERDE